MPLLEVSYPLLTFYLARLTGTAVKAAMKAGTKGNAPTWTATLFSFLLNGKKALVFRISHFDNKRERHNTRTGTITLTWRGPMESLFHIFNGLVWPFKA